MTLQQLADAIGKALKDDPGIAGKRAACELVSAATLDDTFVSTHLKARKAGEPVREVLYEDSESGFCICGHVYADAAEGFPHDHGPSWAIYGQAEGLTRMMDWEVVTPGTTSAAQQVRPVREYTLQRGDAHLYDVGAVHSPHRDNPVKLVRIEGCNLDHVERTPTEASPD